MTRDPIQPLADMGRRVLQTVRYLAMPPVPDQPLESYEGQLRDPVVILSGICDELLERLATAPVAAEPENLPNKPASRLVPAPNQDSDFPTFSHAGAARIPTDGGDEAADSRRENQTMDRPGPAGPGLDFASPFEEVRRSVDVPAPFPDGPGSRDARETAASREPAEPAPQAEGTAPPLRPAIDGYDLSARQTVIHTSRSRDMKHPVERFPAKQPPAGGHQIGPEGEPSPEERGSETRPPARLEWPEARQTELPSDARASGEPVRAENGSTRGAGDSEIPLHGSRLTGSTERLAAMLRSHVAQPEPVIRTAERENQEGENVISSPQGDDERGASRIMDQPARTAGLAGVEEIMERLADELETEFVRTYGSSGG